MHEHSYSRYRMRTSVTKINSLSVTSTSCPHPREGRRHTHSVRSTLMCSWESVFQDIRSDGVALLAAPRHVLAVACMCRRCHRAGRRESEKKKELRDGRKKSRGA
jgi:hypothetical protein